MALVPLFDEVNQFNDYNGTVLAAGKLYVYHLGRTRLADIYSDLNGTVMQNPVVLDNLGRGPIYVSQDFNYTLVVMDEYDQEIFSQDKFIYSQGGPHNSANVAVGASEYIAVSSTQIGDTTVYTPYLTGDIPGPGSGGKTYSGIDPIVVNNDEDTISANTVPFGVQEPLYFVEDETATIIGLSGNPSADAVNWVTAQGYLQRPDLIGYATTDFVEEEVSGKYDTSAFSTISGAFLTAVPGGTMNESAFGYSGGLITAYNGSAFKAGDEFPQSATEAILVVTANSGKWNDTFTALTSNSAVWDTVTNKLDESAFSSVSGDFQTTAGMTAYQPAGDYLTTGDSSNFYTTANPSGFITGVDLTPYQTTAGMTAYASKDDVSGLQSASVWNDTVNTVSSNSASWTGIEYTGVSPIVVDNTSRSISADTWTVNFGSGLSAIDDTANSATTIVVTAQGGGSDVFFAVYGVTTFNEIWSAATAGKAVYAYTSPVTTSTETIDYLQLTYIEKYSDSNAKAYFVQSLESNNTLYTNIASVDSYNTWGCNGYHGKYVPDPSYNSGYVLTENGLGSYSWAAPAGGSTYTGDVQNALDEVYSKSGDWNDTRDTVTANSAYWDRAYSAVDSNSGAWSETYGAVNSMSAEWTSAFTAVNMGSGAWDSAWAAIYGPDASANLWNQSTNTVTAGSGVWDGTYVTVNQNSANWDSTYNTVSNNSASWAGGAGGDMFVSGLAYTTGGEISSYSGSAFASTDPTYELSAGGGISLTTGASALTIGCTLTLATGSI